MQCVSYKQICYQAVNTKVMGLLVLISVFISLYCVGIFFLLCSSRFRPQLCIGTGQGSCCFLHALCSGGFATCLPPPAPAAESPWVSPGWDVHEGEAKENTHCLPWALVSTSRRWLHWFLMVWKATKVLPRQGEGKAPTEDNLSPQVLLNGEGAATWG